MYSCGDCSVDVNYNEGKNENILNGNHSLHQHVDVNECSSADLNNCNQGCENKNGSFQCLCEDGYQLQPDGGTCLGKAISTHQ